MDEQRAQVVVPFRLQGAPNDGQLARVAPGPLSSRFCAWRGASDRRYIATVYPVDCSGPGAGLPDVQPFLLLAVTRSGGTRRVFDVSVIERSAKPQAAIAAGVARGADEWHVLFLAEDPNARAAMIADLRARHGTGAPEARCA